MLFYALALVPLTLACGPGTGALTATPSMTFTYSPALSWTWNPPATAGGGQSLSESAAQNRINLDIESAVKKAVESYGYSTSGVSVRNAIAPQSIELEKTTTTCTKPGNGITVDMAVARKCSNPAANPVNTPATAPSYNFTSTITVNSPIALYESQWDNIATKIYATLSSNVGVRLYGLIKVDA